MTALLAQWVQRQMWWPLVFTGLSLLVAAVCYVWLTRRGRGKWTGKLKGGNLSVLISLTLLLLVALTWIWRSQMAWLEATTDWFLANRVYANIIFTVLVIALVHFVGHVVERALQRGATDLEGKHKIRRAMSWLRAVVLVVALVAIWISGGGQMGVFLGVMGAGIALSMQLSLIHI